MTSLADWEAGQAAERAAALSDLADSTESALRARAAAAENMAAQVAGAAADAEQSVAVKQKEVAENLRAVEAAQMGLQLKTETALREAAARRDRDLAEIELGAAARLECIKANGAARMAASSERQQAIRLDEQVRLAAAGLAAAGAAAEVGAARAAAIGTSRAAYSATVGDAAASVAEAERAAAVRAARTEGAAVAQVAAAVDWGRVSREQTGKENVRTAVDAEDEAARQAAEAEATVGATAVQRKLDQARGYAAGAGYRGGAGPLLAPELAYASAGSAAEAMRRVEAKVAMVADGRASRSDDQRLALGSGGVAATVVSLLLGEDEWQAGGSPASRSLSMVSEPEPGPKPIYYELPVSARPAYEAPAYIAEYKPPNFAAEYTTPDYIAKYKSPF